jgi:hypothetical protein
MDVELIDLRVVDGEHTDDTTAGDGDERTASQELRAYPFRHTAFFPEPMALVRGVVFRVGQEFIGGTDEVGDSGHVALRHFSELDHGTFPRQSFKTLAADSLQLCPR